MVNLVKIPGKCSSMQWLINTMDMEHNHGLMVKNMLGSEKTEKMMAISPSSGGFFI
jgi:hypothetical protein